MYVRGFNQQSRGDAGVRLSRIRVVLRSMMITELNSSVASRFSASAKPHLPHYPQASHRDSSFSSSGPLPLFS